MGHFDYSHQAKRWMGDDPKHLSDFLVRTMVLDLFKQGAPYRVAVDLGGGEGYFSRKMLPFARKIISVELDKEMIRAALAQEKDWPFGIEYHHGDVRHMPFIPDGSVDAAVGNCVTNYLSPDELPQFYSEVHRILVSNGRVLLSMPHPRNIYTNEFGEATIVENEGFDYEESRGRWFDAKVKTVQGKTLEVALCHSRIEDHLAAIKGSGLKLDGLFEPAVPKWLADRYGIFNGLEGKQPYLILEGHKR
ncbi:MAG: class I SAM-dependent methyltransferase [archaeon]